MGCVMFFHQGKGTQIDGLERVTPLEYGIFFGKYGIE